MLSLSKSLDYILVDVDLKADDNDSACDINLGQFSDGCSVFSTDTIDTAKIVDGPLIQHIYVYSAQGAADGPINIEADYPSDTENFADFINAAHTSNNHYKGISTLV